MAISGVDTAAILMVAQSALVRSASRNRILTRFGGWEFPTRWFFRLGLSVLVLDAALQVVPIHFLRKVGGLMHQVGDMASHAYQMIFG